MRRWMMGGLVSMAAVTGVQAGDRVGYVTAESRYGVATITAPVREGTRGLQVQLPGGTWYDCDRSCSEKLRRETIDFWQNHNGTRGAEVDGPGYFLWRR